MGSGFLPSNSNPSARQPLHRQWDRQATGHLGRAGEHFWEPRQHTSIPGGTTVSDDDRTFRQVGRTDHPSGAACCQRAFPGSLPFFEMVGIYMGILL